MHIEVSVPALPESVTDATLMDWHYQVGERVVKDSSLIDLETDKVILEVPVPESGILKEIRHNRGDIVSGGDLLAVIDTTPVVDEPVPAEKKVMSPEGIAAKVESSPAKIDKPGANFRSQPISPAVRRLLTEHKLEPSDIPVSGRITKQDVLDYLENRSQPPSSPVAAAEPVLEADHRQAGERPGERRVPMTRLRARIAERLIESRKSTATLTTFNEVDLGRIYELRQRHRERFEKTHQVKLGLMSFFVKASVEALRRFPIVNASLDETDIVYHDFYDIGIAVSTDRGLVVPVLRDADQLGFAQIEKAINAFSHRGREGKLSYEELSGGTFTITNGGIFGSMLSTPILNPPQSAILGMHAIKDRPVVVDGEIVIRPMIYLALSYDHRIIDGRDAVSFLFTIKELLEDPARLLLET